MSSVNALQLFDSNKLVMSSRDFLGFSFNKMLALVA
jgi:hypothetical protein